MPGPGGSRIPLALQQVFLSSQRGDDVQKIEAPSNGVGFRLFRRSWGRKGKRAKPLVAPRTLNLSKDRSVKSIHSVNSTTSSSAADASRKAMKTRKSKSKPKAAKVSKTAHDIIECVSRVLGLMNVCFCISARRGITPSRS